MRGDDPLVLGAEPGLQGFEEAVTGAAAPVTGPARRVRAGEAAELGGSVRSSAPQRGRGRGE
ncbi:hypothetical protein [Streptomyces sp. NBC_01725]|uniref:hypothetical protein n=1 Tax=Streptomyces sp. NBC_01725 TaxID=2975923 RepID=UPI002E2C0D6E|nr:hypothetical protein [Streptomyces sp. NBC_01725]